MFNGAALKVCRTLAKQDVYTKEIWNQHHKTSQDPEWLEEKQLKIARVVTIVVLSSSGVVFPIKTVVARVITRALSAVSTVTPLNRVEQQALVVLTISLLELRISLLLTVLKLLWIRDVSEPRQNSNSFFFYEIILKRFCIINTII